MFVYVASDCPVPGFDSPRLLHSLFALSIVKGLRTRAVVLAGKLSCVGDALARALVGHHTPCLLLMCMLVRLLDAG